jgi:hypothetical protein
LIFVRGAEGRDGVRKASGAAPKRRRAPRRRLTECPVVVSAPYSRLTDTGLDRAAFAVALAAAAGSGARSWVARRAEAPRWSRMRRMTRPSIMKETTRITPRQRGQTRGSTSYTLRSNCRGAMGIAMPFGAYRPAVLSSFACPAGTRRPTPAPFADLRDGPSGGSLNEDRQAAAPDGEMGVAAASSSPYDC